jgi:hypothetical protein
VLTIGAPLGSTDEGGTLTIIVNVSGSRSGGDPQDRGTYNQLSGARLEMLDSSGACSYNYCALNFKDTGGTATFNVDFNYAVPFAVNLQPGGGTITDDWSRHTVLDYGQTASIGSMTVANYDSQPVTGFTHLAASGHNYLAPAVPALGPGSCSLLACWRWAAWHCAGQARSVSRRSYGLASAVGA